MDLADRIQLTISSIISFSFLLAFILGILDFQWFNAFLAFLALILSYMPAIITRNYKIYLPIELELFLGVFLFATIYLGEIQSFYILYPWWDKFLHTGSGILLGLIGFLIVYIFNSEERIRMHLSPFFVALFSFLFAFSLGGFWEIFEFSADQFFGTTMQQNGLVDTMIDLSVDALGAFFIALLGYFYVKKVQVPLFDRFITRFIDRNPRLFRRFQKD